VESVLDLACGTGSMTLALAERGFDMIGLDRSCEMLSVARDRAADAGVADRILWLAQDMTDFELYGTVEAVVSCLDSINHLTTRDALVSCLRLVHNYLVPGGLFLFDLNSQMKFETLYGDASYVFEAPGTFCTWQNCYNPKSKLCHFDITLFEEGEDGRYVRYDERQTERMYTVRSMKRALAECGFELVGAYGSESCAEITDESERWYFVARAIKS
jgi:SAM-dependent methyltransferase